MAWPARWHRRIVAPWCEVVCIPMPVQTIALPENTPPPVLEDIGGMFRRENRREKAIWSLRASEAKLPERGARKCRWRRGGIG